MQANPILFVLSNQFFATTLPFMLLCLQIIY